VGLDAVILVFWIAQILIVIIFLIRNALAKLWLSATGLVIGLIIGFSPVFFIRGPAVWGPFVVILEVSTATLLLVFILQMRWVAFVFVLLILALPQAHNAFQAYDVFGYKSFSSSNAFLKNLDVVAQMQFFFGPLVCSLAFAAIFSLLDSFLKRQKQA
jgi:hypothetical protein